MASNEMWMGEEGELIRFPCAGCGKILGGYPQMRAVQCAACATANRVPTGRQAKEAMSAIHVGSVDVPLGKLILLGFKIAIAAIPLIVLLMAAACGVHWLITLMQQPVAWPE